MNEIIINNLNGELTVSSLQIARDFGKRHDHVIRDIENIIPQIWGMTKDIKAENSALTKMFIETTYTAGTGKPYKRYDITRDGFSLLVMGFTGKKSLEWKLKYIEAFNLMEDKLRNSLNGINLEEVIVKAVSLAVSETVKTLIPFIMTSTSQPAPQPTRRIRKKYKHTTPSKISTLSPELKRQIDDMIISGEYSCQKIANFIMNNSDIEISQMAVNRYKRNYFSYDGDENVQLSLF